MQKPLSRLEKFLYALYSLDSSELPNPLSRLEVLLNCLVTGETPPAFEPLSRNEKYLMAISGSYHDELPSPISRGEKLLYKLATGDDNIDDIDESLSRYEELLAYIVENGCLDGPINVEYVTYILMSGQNTLYNTAKKPVKSAILKGQTLVNLIQEYKNRTNGASLETQDGYVLQTVVLENEWCQLVTSDTGMVKPSTQYLLVIDVVENTLSTPMFIIGNPEYNKFIYVSDVIQPSATGVFKFKLTSKSAFTLDSEKEIDLFFQYGGGEIVGNKIKLRAMLIEYQDGMENWDIPYFEGMQSVKMPVLTTTGKNLFNLNEAYDDSKDNGISFSYKNTGVVLNGSRTDKTLNSTSRMLNINHLLKPGKTYSISSNYEEEIVCSFRLTKKDGSFDYKKTFEMNNQYSKADVYIQLTKNTTIDNFVNSEILIQLEESSSITPYEPFKSNILTVNEEVELRKVGNVQDELNLLTGELTQCIGEVVLDDSLSWRNNPALSDGDYYVCYTFDMSDKAFGSYNLISDNYITELILTDGVATGEFIYGQPSDNVIYTSIAKSKLTPDENGDYKTSYLDYLNNNPFTVQYQLATESVKTVDLSVVDQDGNEAELSSFDDITHVTVTSDGILPDVELEVATKNKEVLNTISLKMDDIYATQTTLEETSNAQSENVDATMMATTEIYEGLL